MGGEPDPAEGPPIESFWPEQGEFASFDAALAAFVEEVTRSAGLLGHDVVVVERLSDTEALIMVRSNGYEMPEHVVWSARPVVLGPCCACEGDHDCAF